MNESTKNDVFGKIFRQARKSRASPMTVERLFGDV
jgi:hypothetical protein